MDGSRKPHSKVMAGGAAGALSVVVVYALGAAGVSVPPEVASALTTLFAFAAGYLKRVSS